MNLTVHTQHKRQDKFDESYIIINDICKYICMIKHKKRCIQHKITSRYTILYTIVGMNLSWLRKAGLYSIM